MKDAHGTQMRGDYTLADVQHAIARLRARYAKPIQECEELLRSNSQEAIWAKLAPTLTATAT